MCQHAWGSHQARCACAIALAKYSNVHNNNKTFAMKLYRLLDSIPWARKHFERKLGLTLFVASQLTLAIYIAVKFFYHSPHESGVLLILASFGFSTWLASYVMMRLLLAPLDQTATELRNHLDRRANINLPTQYSDVVGQLMRDAGYLARRARKDADYLLHYGQTDPLTGFYTRNSGRRRLGEDLARAERHSSSLHFSFISLDGLNQYAAEYGNDTIDTIIRHAASMLEHNLRKSDWVVRWGEQLFAVGFQGNTQAHETIARLQGIIEKSPLEIAPGMMVAPVVCCGVGIFAKGATINALQTAAAEALLKAQLAITQSDPLSRIVMGEAVVVVVAKSAESAESAVFDT